MRILITGGAGCLGSNLTERYVDAGHEVLVIDNFSTGSREVLPDGVPGMRVVEGTIADAALVERCFEKFEPTHVIHSAASYKDPDDWHEDIATNVTGTVNVVMAAKRSAVRRFVNFQTALCYGRPDIVPIPVTHPTRPISSYGITKTAAEEFLRMSGLSFVSLRLASVIGPRLAIGAIPTFYKRLKEGKPCYCTETVRDFLDIEDFFSLIERVMDEDAPTGIYNAGPGEGRTIKDIFDAVAGYLGVQLLEPVPVVPPAEDDVPAVVLDPTETIRAFDWRAAVGFSSAVDKMLHWYDAHGVTAVYTHLKPRS